MGKPSAQVVIGMDPHKRSVTIEVMSGDESVVGTGRFGTDRDGLAALLRFVAAWPQRVWAIEGCSGIGRHVALRLLGQGEQVVDVPPKLSARARMFATGQGRKTDATDAHSVALVGTRMAGLRPVVNDEQLAVLRVLVDRRRSLGDEHTRKMSQVHHLLLELIPGGAKKDLSAAQAKALLATVRPRDLAGKTRRRVAAELIADLERIYQRKKAANKELTALVAATGTTLMSLHGIGPSGAARLWSRSATSPASRTGTTSDPGPAPPRRRLLRRQRPPPALPRREPTDQPGPARDGGRPAPEPHRGAARFRPAKSRGKTSKESMRSSNDGCPTSLTAPWSPTPRAQETGPGGQRGDDSDSSAAGLTTPHQHFGKATYPDPPQQPYDQPSPPPLDTEGSHDSALDAGVGGQLCRAVAAGSKRLIRRRDVRVLSASVLTKVPRPRLLSPPLLGVRRWEVAADGFVGSVGGDWCGRRCLRG